MENETWYDNNNNWIFFEQLQLNLEYDYLQQNKCAILSQKKLWEEFVGDLLRTKQERKFL